MKCSLYAPVLICFILFLSLNSAAQVFVGGALSQNTTFNKANNPYIVTENLIVPKGITLTIEPGAELVFYSNTQLMVKGVLVARGTESDSIQFVMSTQIPNAYLWNGIVFDSTFASFDATGSYLGGTILSYASIYNSNYSLTISGNSGILIENSLLRKSGDGIYLSEGTNNIIRNCRIEQTGFGIFIPSGSHVSNNRFENNEIINNINIGFLINNGIGRIRDNLITGNKIRNNFIGMYIGNDGPYDVGRNTLKNNYISDNSLEGVRIYQDSTAFTGNFVLNNDVGITLKHSDHSELSENFISQNKKWGIWINDSSTNNLIIQNNILRNGFGIRISAEDLNKSLNNTFLHNTIYQNNGEAVDIESSPQGPFHYNNIDLNSKTYTFINMSKDLIEAENNWWGTGNTETIDSLIYDILDDPQLGLVRYQFTLGQIDTVAPIPPPRNVVKRQVGADVVISWEAVPVNDLKGYFIYCGAFDGVSFSTRIDAGNVTSFVLPAHSVFDSIAVSSFDNLADSISDQVEGHESEYVFAALGPYAGPDTTICTGSSLHIELATAFNYESITWSTSGDGSFSSPHLLKTIYNPGSADTANKQVALTLHIMGSGFNLSDLMIVSFSDPPIVFAGNDTLVLSDTSYLTSEATSIHQTGILWQTSGDGTFSNDTLLHTEYTPGSQDLGNGNVKLTLHTSSVCGSVDDDLNLTILKAVSIHGKVHAGEVLSGGTRLQLFKAVGNVISQERETYLSVDGKFNFDHLTAADYYLYAVPDKIDFSLYAPTYYYNDLHWKDAYRLPAHENTYDVDINLKRLAMALPVGEGSIGGLCTASGVTGLPCQNTIVLLYDKSGQNLLGWASVDGNGSFKFDHLPYGEYLLIGEKAGYEQFFSQVITLSPLHPEVTDAMLHIEPFKISIQIPMDSPDYLSNIQVYPVPGKNKVFLKGLPSSGTYKISLSNVTGETASFAIDFIKGEDCPIDVSKFPAGVYMLRIYLGDDFVKDLKIIKN
ncbi:MAG: right-handed parallel beta-helix repeat-containing protein [Bacteroidetes bacterium]|nr:right-handed parallel beta-helix repeat-containing protein [Bacteroidota bacterium]